LMMLLPLQYNIIFRQLLFECNVLNVMEKKHGG
jgi:hypothetical protein